MQETLTNKTVEKIKHGLVREGFISFDNLLKAEEYSQNNEKNLGQSLIELKMISEKVLLEFIESKLRIPYVNLADYSLDKACLKYISKENAQKYRIIPLFKIEDILTIAMADPMELFTVVNVLNNDNLNLEPIIVSERLIQKAIKENYTDETNVETQTNESFNWQEQLSTENHDDEQIKAIIKSLINQAIYENAEEIILQPAPSGLTVKFKLNHQLQEKGSIPRLLTPVFTSVLKKLSNLNSLTTEVPQLEKFKTTYQQKVFTVLCSVFPSCDGESITLKPFAPFKKLSQYNINEENKKNITSTSLVLICSDNETESIAFAYSLLDSMSLISKNIITIESLTKEKLNGITQVELAESTIFNIEKALKHIEFQHPDIVFFEKYSNDLIKLVQSGMTLITTISNNAKDSIIKHLQEKLPDESISLVFVENKNVKTTKI